MLLIDDGAHSLGRAPADFKFGGNVVKRNPSRLGSQLSSQMKQPSGRFLRIATSLSIWVLMKDGLMF